jgi:hypothetical protein
MELKKIKIIQPTKSLMIATAELTVMMVTIEMTLVVVLRYLPHKKGVMTNFSSFTAEPIHTLHSGSRPRPPGIVKKSLTYGECSG